MLVSEAMIPETEILAQKRRLEEGIFFFSLLQQKYGF